MNVSMTYTYIHVVDLLSWLMFSTCDIDFNMRSQHPCHFVTSRFNFNYGVRGWMDSFMGTDGMFKDSVQYQRHRILLTTEPANVLYPEKQRESRKSG